ncbi:MAG: hypothetical protein QXQ92_03470 [Candidatus Nezhaarchaeales archaeon]
MKVGAFTSMPRWENTTKALGKIKDGFKIMKASPPSKGYFPPFGSTWIATIVSVD